MNEGKFSYFEYFLLKKEGILKLKFDAAKNFELFFRKQLSVIMIVFVTCDMLHIP